MVNHYVHKERAVAFLDVLGFKTKLYEFEAEAIEHYNLGNSFIENGAPLYYSQKANDFINTFNSAVSKLDKDLFSFYLFSDNICITGKNEVDNSSLIELLSVITELYYEFAQKGYFLRGGIDYGLFVDQDSIAVGVPLATAYHIESSKSIFPRIVLSDNFVKQFETYNKEGKAEISNFYINSLIRRSCEINYINIFNYIFNIDDKEGYLNNFKNKIEENLLLNKTNENVYLKFEWLAREFNDFINIYIEELAYLDSDNDPTPDFIAQIQTLKIEYAN